MKLEDYEADLTSYAVEITKYLISRGSQPQDAEDTVQDTFVKMLELDIFIDPTKLRAWMYRTSIRAYIDRYRRAQHYATLMEELVQDLSEFEPAADYAQANLQELMKKMKTQDAQLLQAYYYENKSTKELASTRGVSLSKIKVDLYRARKKLQKIIEKEEIKSW